MKNIHFFGCSFTEGAELADYIYFPWKTSNTTIEEYYSKLHGALNNNGHYDTSYAEKNKTMAYPAQIEKITPGVKCHNHAKSGASQGEMTYKLLKLIYTNNPIDYIFFQLPPPDREIIYNEYGVTSLQLSSFPGTPGNPIQSSYIKYKVLSTKPFATSVENLQNLVLVKETLKAKNIPHCFLEMSGIDTDEWSRTMLKDYPEYHWLLDHGIEFDNPFLHVKKEHTLGLHYTLDTHERVAEYLKNKYTL